MAVRQRDSLIGRLTGSVAIDTPRTWRYVMSVVIDLVSTLLDNVRTRAQPTPEPDWTITRLRRITTPEPKQTGSSASVTRAR